MPRTNQQVRADTMMANRHQRRAEKARSRKIQVKIHEIDSKFDIQVDPKWPQIVMILANRKGRRIVEDLWPDVEWDTDDKFSKVHSAEWLFTHIRVTKLPPYLETAVPLAFASSDSIGFAVASALHRRAWPLRVAFWTGEGDGVEIGTFGDAHKGEDADTALYAEYVPPGSYSSDPDHHA